MPPRMHHFRPFCKTALALAIGQAIACSAQAATLTVDSTSDNIIPNDSACTLREAIVSVNTSTLNTDCSANAPGTNDEIVFAPSITNTSAISLTVDQLTITNDVIVTGPQIDLSLIHI